MVSFTRMFYEKMFHFSNYSARSKHYNDSNKLVVGKMKKEAGGIAIEEFVKLNPQMFFLVDDSSEHLETNYYH